MKNNDAVLRFIGTLKENGFNVYTSCKDPVTYFHFEDKNGAIGYCQDDSGFGGFSFSSVHKPNITTGTGFGISNRIDYPTITHAREALVMYPSWASSLDVKSVKKYKNMAEYLERETVLEYRKL